MPCRLHVLAGLPYGRSTGADSILTTPLHFQPTYHASHTAWHSNRALALLKLNKLAKALADAEECTRLDPSFVKGWYRQAQVLESQGNLEQVGRHATWGSRARRRGVASGGGVHAVVGRWPAVRPPAPTPPIALFLPPSTPFVHPRPACLTAFFLQLTLFPNCVYLQAVAVLKQGCDATVSSGDQELPKQLKLLTRQMARDQGKQPSGSGGATVTAGSALENGGKVSVGTKKPGRRLRCQRMRCSQP